RGWVTFDPTPLGVAPAAGLLSRVGIYMDAADSVWQQWVVSYDTGHQALLANRFADRLRSALYGRRRSLKWQAVVPAGAVRWGTVALALTLAAVAMVWGFPRALRRTRQSVQLHRIARRGGSAGDGRALYEHMLKAMESRGYRKPAWFTPLEFARGLPGEEHERVARFTSLYNSVRFGGHGGEAGELARLLREFGKS
ncbi:MAG: DUF4129 domain-containing protein, partial [Acidobacteriota bacterium]|nr:DUF4129 domain-containing protein [Acidobacteriota bacterium]